MNQTFMLIALKYSLYKRYSISETTFTPSENLFILQPSEE
jgi:hypothetical protein